MCYNYLILSINFYLLTFACVYTTQDDEIESISSEYNNTELNNPNETNPSIAKEIIYSVTAAENPISANTNFDVGKGNNLILYSCIFLFFLILSY